MREQTSATIPVNTVWDLRSVLKLVIHYESYLERLLGIACLQVGHRAGPCELGTAGGLPRGEAL